jgi:homoserine acetyltransferase
MLKKKKVSALSIAREVATINYGSTKERENNTGQAIN